MESIDLVELYLEPVSSYLESVVGRIEPGNIQIVSKDIIRAVSMRYNRKIFPHIETYLRAIMTENRSNGLALSIHNCLDWIDINYKRTFLKSNTEEKRVTIACCHMLLSKIVF